MATKTVSQKEETFAWDVLRFPQDARILSYEEVLALVPYRRLTSSAYGLEYVTAFHMQILLAYVVQYPKNQAEFCPEVYKANRDEIHMRSQSAAGDIAACCQLLMKREASCELIETLWHQALDRFQYVTITTRTMRNGRSSRMHSSTGNMGLLASKRSVAISEARLIAVPLS